MKMPLFFSGGTALRSLAQFFASKGIVTLHLVSTFDSGGSSQILRLACDMPAVGDIRNRLLALMPQDSYGLKSLLAKRLAQARTPEFLRNELCGVFTCLKLYGANEPRHQAQIQTVIADISCLLNYVPNLDLRGASIGNLAITGAYLKLRRNLEAAVIKYSRLLNICGTVLPVCHETGQLVAKLEDGSLVCGQHLFKNMHAPVQTMVIAAKLPPEGVPVIPMNAHLTQNAADSIHRADLVCYPMGSFYSSILAHFLLQGTGAAIANSNAPKVYIPNSGHDPESIGLGIFSQIRLILRYLQADNQERAITSFLNYVVLDEDDGFYEQPLNAHEEAILQNMGIAIIRAPLHLQAGRHDPEKLAHVIMKLAGMP